MLRGVFEFHTLQDRRDEVVENKAIKKSLLVPVSSIYVRNPRFSSGEFDSTREQEKKAA